MRNVATNAPLCALRRMLKDKRPGFFRVAFEADGVASGGSAQLRAQQSAVLIVAIGTAHQFFIHAMVEGLGKLGGNFLMASVTKLRLRLAQNEFLCCGMVGRVAINAADVAGFVRRAQKIAVLLSVLVASEAVAGDVFGSDTAKRKDLCRIAGLGVLAAGPVAAFTSISFSYGLAAERNLAMRSGIEGGVSIGVAFFAPRGANIIGGLRGLR